MMIIPQKLIDKFQRDADSINYGIVTLQLHKKCENGLRFVLKKEESFLETKDGKPALKVVKVCKKEAKND